MDYTLHLTTECNFRCKYCYFPLDHKALREMDSLIIDDCISFITNNKGGNIGISFFGGEPLLKKDLIFETVEKLKSVEKQKGNTNNPFRFFLNITTNGYYLDEEFLQFAKDNSINIAISIDGCAEAHNKNRVSPSNEDTYQILHNKFELILKYAPFANVMMVVNPNTLHLYAESVQNLIENGFRYIIATLNYAANWQDNDLITLEDQLKLLYEYYKKWSIEGRKFYFSPFEMKIASHVIANKEKVFPCKLGHRQVSIAPDGKLYPCVQFVQDAVSNTQYSIGDIYSGYNSNRQKLLEQSKRPNKECQQCILSNRCYNTCACLNWQTTGNLHEVSPMFCNSEQLYIKYADQTAEALFAQKVPIFMQKHYNKLYPYISALEEKA